jgi:hypothetical protein
LYHKLVSRLQEEGDGVRYHVHLQDIYKMKNEDGGVRFEEVG